MKKRLYYYISNNFLNKRKEIFTEEGSMEDQYEKRI